MGRKKSFSDAPWFAPFIITIFSILFTLLLTFIKGPTPPFCFVGGSCSHDVSYENTWQRYEFFLIPVLFIVWTIFFPIYYAHKKNVRDSKTKNDIYGEYAQDSKAKDDVYEEYIPKTVKKMTFDKFSVIFSIIMNLVSVILILIVIISSNRRTHISGSVMGGDEMMSIIGYALTMPVRIISIILSIISISNNKTKFKSINKMPEEIRKLTTRNIISMIILIILTIVPFLYVFLPMLGLRLKFAGI